MKAEEINRAVEGITEVLACIAAGRLRATRAQRSYLTGALGALRAVLEQAEAHF